MRLTVDSSRHRIVILAGPYDLPAEERMEGMEEMHHAERDVPVRQFAWPFDTWLRGFRLELIDSAGRPLPRRLLHHLSMMNFDRRELVYPIVERLLGAGQETPDIVLPRTVGIPMKAGQRIGLYVMWRNETGHEVRGVYLRLVLPVVNRRQMPRPVGALPFLADVNFVYGGRNGFTVPPGRSERPWEFTVPVTGRLLVAGGHLHDYGVGLRLEDATTGRVLFTLTSRRDSAGRVVGMSRRLFAVRGEGLRLRADRRYRLVAIYDNPTPRPLVGVMGSIAGLFVPDDPRRWPTLDPTNLDYLADLAFLSSGVGDMDMHGNGP
jgi:hypothetical protein